MKQSKISTFKPQLAWETLVLSNEKRRNKGNYLLKGESRDERKVCEHTATSPTGKKGKEKSIIAAGPLRVAAVIARI